MKKLINNPSNVVEEMLEGLVSAHSDQLERLEDTHAVHRKQDDESIVGLVSGGGSGHEPAHAGFVGDGMLSAAVLGEVFTSPTPDQILEAIKASDHGQGVFLIVKNYSGDVMNFQLAEELAQMEEITVDHVIVEDDIAIEPLENKNKRRGIAGTVLMHKILGYYAREGQSVAELKEIAEHVMSELKTIGLALTAATVPEVGKPGFAIADDEFEFGIGIHGEPGYKREKLMSSHDMAKELIHQLKDEFHWQAGDHYAVLVNGMGSTPQMELYLFWNDIRILLESEGITVDFVRVEEWMTSIDMAGASLTMLHLDDLDWLTALNSPVHTIAWNNE
ncbi:MAG: dihydroxyacetone kinase subunit DhaK [Aerococcus sp.]|nr:dihydroxyacetone kinase subunit DhaK [Aerococcus sp.]